MTMIAPLPVELEDKIIDYLHNDHPALLACSLVSRTFCTCSQSHLFDSVTLSSEPVVANLDAALSRSPHIAQHIRCVHLPIDPHQCVPFLAHGPFPRVDVLDFHPGSFTTPLPHMDTAFPNLVSLTIGVLETMPIALFLDILHAFPRLRHLHLSSVTIVAQEVNTALSQLELPAPALKSLVLDGCNITSWTALTHPVMARHLRGLRCLELRSHLRSPYFVLRWAGLLNSLAGTLEELRILGMEVPDPTFNMNSMLSPQRSLRRLSISIDTYQWMPEPSFLRMIRQVREFDLDPRAHVTLSSGSSVFCDEETWGTVLQELARAPLTESCTIALPLVLAATESEKSRIAEVRDALAVRGISLIVGNGSTQ